MTLVGLHDTLHQAVPHHVPIVEMDEADALHSAQYVDCIAEAAALAGGKIDLREVTSNNHLGIETLAGEHHLHLLGRAVLGFIENDEAVVQSAPAHECNGSHF